MNSNKININSVNKYFKEGDVIISGGGKAKIRIKEILEHGIRFQSVTTPSYKGLLRYNKLNVVLNNFRKIPGNKISLALFNILKENGLFDSTRDKSLWIRERVYERSKF